MAESLPVAVRGPWRPAVRLLLRTGRRTLAESVYLLTAPVIAAAGLLLVLSGLCVALAGLLRPGQSRVAVGALVPARWLGDVERWRITKVRTAVTALPHLSDDPEGLYDEVGPSPPA